MPVLPDKILEDFQIDAFINRVNGSAEKIISDPKFKLTTPNLPGFSLLLKLQIRVFEKSLAAAFSPIFLGKEALSGGLRGVKRAFDGIKAIFESPLQFLLDEGVNNVLGEFPFPIRFEIGSGSSSEFKIPQGDGRSFSSFDDYSYTGVFKSTDLPSAGQYTTQQESIPQISRIFISTTTNGGLDNPLIQNLTLGDEIQISDDRFLGTYIVNDSAFLEQSQSVRLDLTLKAVKDLENNAGETTIPGFSNSTVSLNGCQLAISSFIQPNGKLKVSLQSLGINIPLLSSLSVSLGDFTNVQDSSPTKQYINKLSEETGLNFQEVLSGIFSGKFPSLDFAKIQEETQNGISESNEQSKENLIALARIIEIASTNPCFLISIIINYLKLLLLPIRLVIGVLKGLGEMVTGPIKLIKTIIKGITDPIGLICDLVAKAFLEVIRPYIQSPLQAANITWEEALNDPDDPNKGLQPLISDMVCGRFSRNLRNYVPNPSFFENLAGSLGVGDNSEMGPQITYDLITNGNVPREGQVLVNSDRISQITNFKVSSFSNTVENALPYLVYLSPGDEFDFQFGDQSGKYRISTKNFVNNGDFPYFDINVIRVKSLLDLAKEKSIGDLILDGVNIESLKASLSIDNPDKSFLLIIEKYLPTKIVAIWEAIKGIIALFGGLAQQIPSLIPAILAGLFGLASQKSREEILEEVESGNIDLTGLAVSSAKEVVNLLYEPDVNDPALIYVATSGKSDEKKEAREVLADIIQNSPASTDPGIEEVFYGLYDELQAAGKTPSIVKRNLSTALGPVTKDNGFLNRKRVTSYVYNERSPSKNDFYWGALNLNDVGDTVKVLSVIMYAMRDKGYTTNSKLNTDKETIVVYKNSDDGNSREVIYSGTILRALNKFRFTKLEFKKKESYYDIRIKINRQMDFLVNYGLPSLLES